MLSFSSFGSVDHPICLADFRAGAGELIGPILMGMSRPVHVLQRTATVEEVVNLAAIAVVDAQEKDNYNHPHVHLPLEPELVGQD